MERLDKTELALIEQFLIDRIIALREIELSTRDYDNIAGKRKDLFSLVVNVDLLNKVISGVSYRYSTIELAIINNCVNRNLRILMTKMPIHDSTKWFADTAEERECMVAMYACKSILRKTGHFKKYGRDCLDYNFSFKAVIQVIDKIQQSTKVLIHKTAAGSIDKIAFVFNDSKILNLKLGRSLHIFDMSFTKLPPYLTLEAYARKRHAILASRETAISTLQNNEVDFYSTQVKELIFAMLGKPAPQAV